MLLVLLLNTECFCSLSSFSVLFHPADTLTSSFASLALAVDGDISAPISDGEHANEGTVTVPTAADER